MGWDIFISHASEDKTDVAVPLKAALEKIGISVWFDLDQISLGDGLSSRIDTGLQQCRYGVVILSPNFFKKSWAKGELNALIAKEMSVDGTTILLPVLHDLSFAELQKHSPLVAGKLAIRWSDGIENVVKAIARVVMGSSVPVSASAIQPPRDHAISDLNSLVLFVTDDFKMAYMESIEIDIRGEEIDFTLKCAGQADADLIREFGASRAPVAVAFDMTAMLGKVHDAQIKKIGGKTTATLKMVNAGLRGGNPMEMSFNGYTADQLAVLRARRILLDERLGGTSSGGSIDPINDTMLNMFVAGQDGIKIASSPIPTLYAKYVSSPKLFLALSKLACVLFLNLSYAVERITKLDLKLDGSSLSIDFSGWRAKRFSNMDPTPVEIKGKLALGKSMP